MNNLVFHCLFILPRKTHKWDWFFDRLGDELAKKYDYKNRDNIIINHETLNGFVIASFAQSTEMAAYFCEEYFNKIYDRSSHQDGSLLRKLDKICKNYRKPLQGIFCELEEQIKKSKDLK